MISSRALCGWLAILAVLASTAASAKERSFGCEKVWSGPDEDNGLMDCLIDGERLKSHWRYYIYPGVAALVLLFIIIGLPVVFICNCCCCKGKCCQCCWGTDNPKRSRCCLWGWIGVALVMAACVCVLIIAGASITVGTASNTLDDVEKKPLDYFINTKNDIMALLTDYSQDPPAEPNIDLSQFDEMDDEVRDQVSKIRDDYFKYFDIVRIVSYCVGAVGVVLILLIVPCACCRCSGCCPMAFSVLYWFFAFIFSILAVALLILMYGMQSGCGEVNLQYKRQPGLSQWLLIPWCEDTFDFSTARSDIHAEVLSACQSACDELLNYCDTSATYDTNTPEVIFVCGNGLTSSAQCTTPQFVADTILKSYIKPILNNALCTDTTGWEYQEDCTVVECAQRCENMNTPSVQAKDWSGEVVRAAQFAINASTALSLVDPMLDCNFIMDKVMSVLEVPPGVSETDPGNCSQLATSSIMLGTGFFVGTLMFILGIYILHRGGFVWSKNAGKSPSGGDEHRTTPYGRSNDPHGDGDVA